MTYKALIFDLDNTLIDFSKSEDLSLNAIYQQFFSAHVGRDTFKNHYHLINRKLWEQVELGTFAIGDVKNERFRRLIQTLQGDHNYQEVAHHYESGLVDHADWFPGVKETLHLLKNHYKLAIITNGFSELQDAKCQKLNITPICDCYIVSEDVGIAKPDKAIFEIAFQKLNIEANQILMIGDSLASDYLGAQNAAMDFCWVNSEDQSLPLEMPKPKYIVHSVNDIPQLILDELVPS